jgi:hypothetical protein
MRRDRREWKFASERKGFDRPGETTCYRGILSAPSLSCTLDVEPHLRESLATPHVSIHSKAATKASERRSKNERSGSTRMS